MKSTYVLIASIIVAIIVVVIAFTFGKPETKVEMPVKIQEYSDFNCSHCKEFHTTIIQLREKYKNDENVKYEFVPNPILGPVSEQAAFAAEAAKEQGKYNEYVDLLYENFEAREDSDYETFAKELELDIEKFNADRENPELQQRILDQLDENLSKKINSTPTLLINDKKELSRDYDTLVEKIEDLVELGEKQS
jgi:protein-disulfide isomerase